MRPNKPCQYRSREVQMTPRLDSSIFKSQSSFPPDALKLIQESLQEQYAEFLADKVLVVQGVIYPKELILSVGFRDKGGIRQRNFEASMDFDLQTQNPVNLIHAGLDAVGSMMSQWIETDGDLAVPLEWTKFDLDKNPLWLRSTNVNSDLEAQANALLGQEFLERQIEITEETMDALFTDIRTGAIRPDESVH